MVYSQNIAVFALKVQYLILKEAYLFLDSLQDCDEINGFIGPV